MQSLTEEIRRQLGENARVMAFSTELVARIAQCAEKSAAAIDRGGKLVFFGNGGSAADALHLAAEFVVKLQTERRALPALALTANPSVLTAAANDYGFEYIFARQIESLVTREDVLVALSTSGNSRNIVRGVEAGQVRGCYLIGLTGETGGAIASKLDLLLNVSSRDSRRIQEAHIAIGHIACSLIERLLS